MRRYRIHSEQSPSCDPELDAVVRLIIGIVHRAQLDAYPQRRSLRPPDPQAERVQREAQLFLDWLKQESS